VARGHRRILCYAPGFDPELPTNHYAGAERIAGYRTAMTAAGLQPLVRSTPMDRDADFHARVLHADLAGVNRPTAVLCMSNSDLVVYGAMRRGLRVPEDLAICTFTRYRDKDHDLPVGRLRIPEWELGAEGVAMLLRRIAEPDRIETSLRLPVPLIDDRFLTAIE
jgi:DNA-binding LacI/PurR family transcriptional regulator